MFIDGLEEELNKSVTENGAFGYATTGKALVDFNFKVSSFRGEDDNKIIKEFNKVWYGNKELALKYIFFARDIRGGLGERNLFRVAFKHLLNTPELKANKGILKLIPEYGRWDDLIYLLGENKEADDYILDIIKEQLELDMQGVLDNKPISLLAKWMPSINTSSEATRDRAKNICKKFGVNQNNYRKMLSKLRKYLDVTEVKTCSNEWSKIDYEKVPSNANLKYKNAFLKHDEKRRQEYLAALEEGKAKINSSVLFPHDIVHNYSVSSSWGGLTTRKKDTTLEQLWKQLPDFVKSKSNTLVVRDGSASMGCRVGNSLVSALEVATALAIYFSEKCEGQFKDKFITFSSNPELIPLENYETLHDKLRECYSYDDCSNTDIEKTFDLILKVALNHNLKQEEIPNLLIISDMEFDQVTYSVRKKVLFKHIEDKFKAQGYILPKLIFWNVNSRTNTIPLTENENGVILVSGFSPAIAKMVLSEKLDPFEVLLEQITSDRYKQITLNTGK